MERTSYPSDLPDEHWKLVEPLIPLAKPGGQPCKRKVESHLFSVRVRGNSKVLLKGGLEKGLWERFVERPKGAKDEGVKRHTIRQDSLFFAAGGLLVRRCGYVAGVWGVHFCFCGF